MTQHEFDILTQKYLAGDCSPAETALLEKWSEMHMSNEDPGLFADESEVSETEERLWYSIKTDAGLSRPKVFSRLYKSWVGIAACIALAMVSCFVYFYESEKSIDLAIHGIETKNVAHSRQKVVLPDGSIVILEKNAKIITDEKYGNGTRTVYLTGEAFFDVKRNTKVPFLVHAGDLVTEVLGTSFRIKPGHENKTIEVSVKTGRVSVYAMDPKQTKKFNGAIITPNQKVSYDTEHRTIRQDIVDVPELILTNASVSDFQFEETPIDTVLPFIQKAYGVEIVLGNTTLNHCAFTGNLNGLTMYKQLDFICDAINARYEIRGTTIFVTGSGCKN